MFSERRYVYQIAHFFAVTQYLGLIARFIYDYKHFANPKYWVTLRCQGSYRLEENIWRWAAFKKINSHSWIGIVFLFDFK